jgi:hypothetical protein
MIESLFILYRITGDEQYREWAWQTFQAIEKHCKMDGGGYAALLDVRRPTAKEDKMESFFLAETLKSATHEQASGPCVGLDEDGRMDGQRRRRRRAGTSGLVCVHSHMFASRYRGVDICISSSAMRANCH